MLTPVANMKNSTVLALTLFTMSTPYAYSTEIPEVQCPDAQLGETAEDCPWAGIARVLVAEADQGKPIGARLKSLAPGLMEQVKKDSARAALQNLWGKSSNYDEFAKGTIVHPAILETLGETFQIPMAGKIVHAGLEHTYGYLFSVLKTPFGYKRARWVRNVLEDGFELPAKTLSPTPAGGTFFANVTYFIGSIAFRDRPEKLKLLKAEAPHVSKAVTGFPYSKLKTIRLEETLETPKKVTIRTDFVPFIHVPKTEGQAQPNSHLLVYSVLEAAGHDARLITAFPVDSAFVERALKAEGLGKEKPVQTRYNAYVDGITGQTLTGLRKIAKEK